MMLLSMLLVSTLAGAPAAGLQAAPGAAGEPSPGELEAYEAARAELEAAEASSDTNEGPEVGVRLERAIARILEFGPQLAADEIGRETLLYARLSLARNYYIMDPPDPEAGDEVLEFVLRTTLDINPKIVERFRPYFGSRYEKTKAALESEGKGRIEVVCHTDCEIVVGYQPAPTAKVDVYLGTHAVIISAKDGSVATRELSVDIREPGEVETIEFGAPPTQPAEPAEPEEPEVPAPALEVAKLTPPAMPRDLPPSQVLPRWLEVGGLVAGAGLVATGIGVFTFDGDCADPQASVRECPRVWEATPAGAITLGIGSGLLFSSIALLVVDERRARNPEHRRVSFRPPGVVRF